MTKERNDLEIISDYILDPKVIAEARPIPGDDTSTRLVEALRQYQEGVVTYGEFIRWVLYNVPAPGVDVTSSEVPGATSTEYRSLYAVVETVVEIEEVRRLAEQVKKDLSEMATIRALTAGVP